MWPTFSSCARPRANGRSRYASRLARAVFVYLLAACVTTGVAFGLGPAIVSVRRGTGGRASDTGRALMSRGGGIASRLRDSLVIVEVALAFVLLSGAGL